MSEEPEDIILSLLENAGSSGLSQNEMQPLIKMTVKKRQDAVESLLKKGYIFYDFSFGKWKLIKFGKKIQGD